MGDKKNNKQFKVQGAKVLQWIAVMSCDWNNNNTIYMKTLKSLTSIGIKRLPECALSRS